MSQRKVWFVKATNASGDAGLGEVAPIHRLSPEELDDIEPQLKKLASKLKKADAPVKEADALRLAMEEVADDFPSIRFGLETALLDLVNHGSKSFFGSDPDHIKIPVNGLIWMGDKSFMKVQIKEKLDQGYKCIKLKVGALDFRTEVKIIQSLRAISKDLIIRLDANGAFTTNEVLFKLRELAKYRIHSIEQPILPGQPEVMGIVCQKSEIPIALDEELIGINKEAEKVGLLQELKPHYLVLKPTLHGGITSVREWIDLAGMHGIEWWITSYLESNLGLNAIAQLASTYPNEHHSGLGTGALYHNNIKSPLIIDHGFLKYDTSKPWDTITF